MPFKKKYPKLISFSFFAALLLVINFYVVLSDQVFAQEPGCQTSYWVYCVGPIGSDESFCCRCATDNECDWGWFRRYDTFVACDPNYDVAWNQIGSWCHN